MNKYYLYSYNKKKIKLINSNNNKKELILESKKKYFSGIVKDKRENITIVILKIKKVKFNENQPIKMIFGPIKVEINFYQLSKRGSIKENKYETRNNHIFYTKKFLEKKKILKKDLKKIVDFAINNKLEKRLLAPKVIDQIF